MPGMKVMIAVDGSEFADHAVDYDFDLSCTGYLSHVHLPGNEVLLAHVCEPEIHPSFGFRAGLSMSHEDWENLGKEAEEREKALKSKYVNKLKSAGVERVSFKSEHGRPENHLVHIAQSNNVGLVVMGSRGLGKVRRTILGSVSDYVLHHLHMPVAVCRTEQSAH